MKRYPPTIPTRPHRVPAAVSVTASVAAAAVVAALSLLHTTPAAAAETKAAKPAVVAKGKYLVHTSGCMDCHTPLKMGANGPEPDMSRLLSGHPEALQMPPAPVLPEGPWVMTAAGTNTAWSGPWGVSFTANLTPDVDTGLGAWTVRDFKATIRTGKHMGRGRPVLPPMPIPVINNFTDADLEAIFAYLQTLPAIKNRVPEPRPPAPR